MGSLNNVELSLPQKAFEQLFESFDDRLIEVSPKDFDGKVFPRLLLRYSGKFSDFNANVKMLGGRYGRGRRPKPLPPDYFSELHFSLSRKFYDVDESIQIGVLQHLLNRVYGSKISSMEQDFYNSFLKQLSKYASASRSVEESDPLLVELFNELNEEFFDGLMDRPLIVFGRDSTTTLGHYQYAKDKVTISTILRSHRLLLKFVLYHELLHKKHSFTTSSSGRSQYHTRAFRHDEKEFSRRLDRDIDKELSAFVKKKKIGGLFKWF